MDPKYCLCFLRQVTDWVPLAAALFLTSSVASADQAVDLRLPSLAAGGGTLAVRVDAPDPGAERFSTGAPVVVMVPGGWEGGTLSGIPEVQAGGVAVVSFLFPGSAWGGIESDGVYDSRGPLCNQALADVIAFALGHTEESHGERIDAVVGARLDLGNVGIAAYSNGGPVSMAALARFGRSLEGLRFFAGWENPTSAQSLAGDFGPRDCDPRDGDGDGNAVDDERTDAYLAYGFPACQFDFTGLRWDPDALWSNGRSVEIGALYLERTGNDTYDTVERFGCHTADLDNSALLDPDEDQILPALKLGPGEPRYYSPTLLAAVVEQGVFDAGGWPAGIATPEESAEFFFHRDATLHYAAAAAKLPELAAILIFSEQDHVQITPDHVHIHNAYDGFWGNGLWCRLNPDRAYLAALAPSVAPELLPDNPANMVVSDWTAGPGFALPEIPVLGSVAMAAAVFELTDRVRRGDWSDDLDESRQILRGFREPGSGAIAVPAG